jgi:serine palmitoyltransferase
MGSYNYLGFAENNEDFLKTVADKTLQYGVGVCSSRQEVGESGELTNLRIEFCSKLLKKQVPDISYFYHSSVCRYPAY